MKYNEIKQNICAMSEEQFESFCKNFSKDEVKVFQGMRFFEKLYNDKAFYNVVCNAVGEAIYEDFTL